MTGRMLESLTASHFPVDPSAAWTVLVSEDQSVPLTVEATVAGGDPRPFTVTFAGPLEPQLEQRMYAIEHAEVGKFPLFIVPVAREADGMRYEAVFG